MTNLSRIRGRHLLATLVIAIPVVYFFRRGGIDPSSLRRAGLHVSNWNYIVMKVHMVAGEYMVIGAVLILLFTVVGFWRNRREPAA